MSLRGESSLFLIHERVEIDEDWVYRERYRLRQSLMSRETELFICLTMCESSGASATRLSVLTDDVQTTRTRTSSAERSRASSRTFNTSSRVPRARCGEKALGRRLSFVSSRMVEPRYVSRLSFVSIY